MKGSGDNVILFFKKKSVDEALDFQKQNPEILLV